MGRDAQLCCKECKKNYYLGYASYRSIIFAETLDRYKEIAAESDQKELYVNLNTEKVLTEHENHELIHHSGDWCFEKNGNLFIEGGYGGDTILVEGYSLFEQINLDVDSQ